jgi:rhodanese-related sulfurtransferase
MRDIKGFLVLIALSLFSGAFINYFRSESLALIYQTPEERLHLIKDSSIYEASATHKISEVSVEELEGFLNKSDTLILDARANVFYKIGHIPSALNLPRDSFDKDYPLLEGKLKDSNINRIIVYCSGETCEDSNLVARALIAKGYKSIQVYRGGWEEWCDLGLNKDKS